MFKTIDDNQVVITDDNGYKTVISPPEDLTFEIGNNLSIEFQSDVSGLNEHYIAVATNYNDIQKLNEAIECFNHG